MARLFGSACGLTIWTASSHSCCDLRDQPVPVSEVSVGEFVDGDSYLGVTVGGIEIVYQLRSSAVSKVAEMLLTATADKTYNQ